MAKAREALAGITGPLAEHLREEVEALEHESESIQAVVTERELFLQAGFIWAMERRDILPAGLTEQQARWFRSGMNDGRRYLRTYRKIVDRAHELMKRSGLMDFLLRR
ncbi:hypothetical protein ACFVU2_19430 [Leifsonia sp. NPDC058194]|uniref:hypothetical protein n=1 Tax=Leifsonia sp. NPDC058194 TaxID=3346374 RepID=UPI0036DD61E0